MAGLGIVGISLTGLPLAFLEDPKLIVLFGGMGLVSLGASMTLHTKATRRSFRAAGLRGFFDRKMVILVIFLLLSVWSVTTGVAQMIRVAAAADAPTQSSKDGSVEVELTLLNLKESWEREMSGSLGRSSYCPVCGQKADGQLRRLGEIFCSEAHADEFAREVQVLVETGRNQGDRKA